MIDWAVVITLTTSGLIALAAIINSRTGMISNLLKQQRDEKEEQSDLIGDAMKLIAGQRVELQAIEQRQLTEAQGLRERIRILEARVSELEVADKQKDQLLEKKDDEIRTLKSKLYDAMHPPERRRPRKIVSIEKPAP